MSGLFLRFWKSQSGASAIEYALIASLVSVAIVAGAIALGGNLGTTFNNVATNVK